MYGRNYLRVRLQDTSEGNTIQNGNSKTHHYVTEIHVRTGKSDYLIEFTEKTGDLQDSTEGQPQHQ